MTNFRSSFERPGLEPSFSNYHIELWDWVWNLSIEERPNPFIAIWPREAGKSTNAELACISIGYRRVRNYVVYISGTQEQANDHVGNIASALESSALSIVDPQLCDRRIGRYGQSKGWRLSRLRTNSGLTIDAVGLDAMGRGAKIDNQRPDFIVLDDIDKDHDSALLVQKKINTLTRKILPSGAPNVAILAVQNLVHGGSIFAQLADGRAEFMSNRSISGPHPALKDLAYETKKDGVTILTNGTPTWDNLSLERCQKILDDIGLTAFLSEYQHDKTAQQGAFFKDIWVESILSIDSFIIPPNWRIDRSFDYGYSKPFSVQWWTVSDGETPVGLNNRIYPRNTLFGIHEWYGWNGKPNQGCRLTGADIATTILQIEQRTPYLKGRVKPGPADSSIWDGPITNNIASEMAAKKCMWYPVDKGPGSRVNGARLFRERIIASSQSPMTEPGIFFWKNCPQIIRCLRDLPRDITDPDDVSTDAEDHNYDSSRYRIVWKPQTIRSGRTVGMY